MTKVTVADKKVIVIAYLVAMTLTLLCFIVISKVVHSRDTIRYVALMFLCFTSFAGIFNLIIFGWKFFFAKFPMALKAGD